MMGKSLVLHTLLVVLLAAITLTSSRVHKGGRGEKDTGGVVLRSRNKLGEEEIRVRYGKYHALEVLVPKLREAGMYYRQITDGRHFLQGIFQGRGNLIDCETNKDREDIRKFLDDFRSKETAAKGIEGSAGNVSIHHVHDRKLLDPISSDLLDVSGLRRSCKVLHRRLRQQLREAQRRESDVEKSGNAHAAFDRLQGQEVPLIKSEVPLRKSKKSATTATTRGSSRAKRYIYPGTNWCGNGNSAHNYHDLGENVATDKCCRGHDHCPYTINGFTTRYNLFNYRFHTLSHCQCDEIFRTCLRSAANSVADMVGNVFFNVAQLKCITLKKIQVCSSRSWWGRCLEYEDDYEAEVHEPFDY